MRAGTTALGRIAAPLAGALALAGCLEPQVSDEPGASGHILPPGSAVPGVADNPELLNQIASHDGLDDVMLAGNGGVVPRLRGYADGQAVRYWDFGPVEPKVAALYLFQRDTVEGPAPLENHLFLLDTVPGDPGYSPYWAVYAVTVTSEYAGELFTTVEALSDGIDLGLLGDPEPLGVFFNCPMVPPGTQIEVGGSAGQVGTANVFARGHVADVFIVGSAPGPQPEAGGIEVLEGAVYEILQGNRVNPLPDNNVFQYGIPSGPPGQEPNYTALVRVVEVIVDEAIDVEAEIHGEADLFTRDAAGELDTFTDAVEHFQITETINNWPLQFAEGEL